VVGGCPVYYAGGRSDGLAAYYGSVREVRL